MRPASTLSLSSAFRWRRLGNARSTAEERDEAKVKNSVAVLPLAIPLLTGPGTISTVIVYANKSHYWCELLELIENTATGTQVAGEQRAGRVARPPRAVLGRMCIRSGSA
ncbi:hypothetical protein KM188_04410 [Mycetohabitans sp. B4]|nr:hypothetical protein [Mycetohabitans sp. B4]